MPAEPEFLGMGWAFPPTFGLGGAEVETVSGSDDIRQSLELLLSTHPAERLLGREFGCDLSEFLFQEVDRELLNGITSLVSDAILRHETRITLNNVSVLTQELPAGRLILQVDYTIRATNSRFNLVYPFYLNEASPFSG